MSIEYAPQARDDLRQALDYLFDRNPRAATELQEAIEKLLEQLDSNLLDGPPSHRSRGRLVRSYVVSRWRLFYERLPEGVLQVVRIYHQRRRPLTKR